MGLSGKIWKGFLVWMDSQFGVRQQQKLMNLIVEDLPYLNCCKNNHNQELSQVCIDKKCVLKALICPLCEETEHQGHSIVPFKQFLTSIEFFDDHVAAKLALQLQFDLSSLQEKFKNELARVRAQFLQKTYELETRVTYYFNQLNEKFYQSFQKSSETRIVQALTNSLSSPNPQKLETLITELKASNQISLHHQFSFYKAVAENKFQAFLNSCSKLNFNEQIKRISNLLVAPLQPFSRFNYRWSNQKAPSIAINGNVATQKSGNSATERFALIESNSNTNGDIRVKFKISKLKGWIGVGICLREKILKAGYKFNYTQPQHGSYLISANGYSWSHSRPEYNSAFKSFVFHEGDTISVDYSVVERKVSFESKLTGSKFYLSTVDCPGDDCYLPCANLCNTGDEVQIINDIQ